MYLCSYGKTSALFLRQKGAQTRYVGGKERRRRRRRRRRRIRNVGREKEKAREGHANGRSAGIFLSAP